MTSVYVLDKFYPRVKSQMSASGVQNNSYFNRIKTASSGLRQDIFWRIKLQLLFVQDSPF